MSETQKESGNTREVQTESVKMRRTDTVVGNKSFRGYRFTLTDALSAAGFTPEMVGERDLYVWFSEQPDETITGIVVEESDIPAGQFDNHHKIYRSAYTLQVYFTEDQLDAYGFEVEGDRPPIFDTWGGNGAIALSTMDIQEVVVERDLPRPIDALPKRMQNDYLAVERDGISPRELAEEYAEQMDSPVSTIEWNIEQNVEEAKRRLDNYEQTDN